ncbi:MAG: amidohydrolase family protein [Rhodospirillales bacterium]|nr:amidohydrolase family protein [Alphaproteobacteria bacterium]MBL6948462.1 amidohydrolase family protein [Rhodospirillales bacterium]
MKHLPWIVMALAVGFVPAPAAAQKPTPEKILSSMDDDGDGRVSREEWLKPPPAFKRIDTNNDGFLTYKEMAARFGGGAKKNGSVKWIDVHVHPNGGRGIIHNFPVAVKMALDVMDDNNISHMVLMPTPQIPDKLPTYPLERFIEEARKFPDRFVVMGGGGTLNPMIHDESPDGHPGKDLKERFAERAEAIMEMGAVGFGELSLLHLSLVPGHAFEDVPGDHPLFLLLADITAKHDVVIDVHFDPVVEDIERPDWLSRDNPSEFKRNLDGFERFLEHNRNAKISWAHAGSDQIGHWTTDLTRRMLKKHPNLYMSLRMTRGRSKKNHPLTPQGIDPEWMSVFQEFPDRFFLGGDQMFSPPGSAGPAAEFAEFAVKIRRRSNWFLSYLPPKLARMIGYENAMRVYKIKK